MVNLIQLTIFAHVGEYLDEASYQAKATLGLLPTFEGISQKVVAMRRHVAIILVGFAMIIVFKAAGFCL